MPNLSPVRHWFRHPLLQSVLALLALALVLALGYHWKTPPAVVESSSPQEVKASGRLPQDVIPDHYRIELRVFPDEQQFSGRTQIRVRVLRPVDRIYLHGRDLALTSVHAEYEEGERVNARWEKLSDTGLASLVFEQPLQAGFLRLNFEHSARYSHTFEGLHSLEDKGQHYAVTQLEPIDARRVFPSFDEPGFKATFDLTLDIPAGQTAVANAAVLEQRNLDARTDRVRFKTTQRLPSYAVAFAVGPFRVLEGKPIAANAVRKQEVPLRALTVASQSADADLMLQHTAPMVQDMEEYFGIPYAFDKIDILAIPGFSSTGLAPPGLFIYQDNIALVTEQSSPEQLHEYFIVHAHEVAHNWFGNLVTPPWWNDTWLSESFADWMAYRSLHKIWPERGFALENAIASSRAMRVDGFSQQHPLRQRVSRDEDVGNTYDDVTYFKGSGVMAMLEQFVGADSFREALRNYFARHAFGNATAEEFVDAIADRMGSVDAQEAFLTFLDQPGVPVVTVTRQCKEGRLQLLLKQQRYTLLSAGQSSGDLAPTQQWGIPLCVHLFDSKARQCTLVRQAEQVWDLDAPCDATVLPNAQGSGYYRWLIDADNLHRLFGTLPEMSDAQAFEMSSNMSAAFRAGKYNANTLLRFLRVAARHRNPDVALPLLQDARFLLQHIANPEQKDALLKEFRALWPVDHFNPDRRDLNAFARDRLLGFQALLARDPTLRKRLLNDVRNSQWQPPAGMNSEEWRVAMHITAQEGSSDEYAAMIEAYRREPNPSLRDAILDGLAGLERVSDLPRLQTLILDNTLPLADRWYLLNNSLEAPALQDAQWQWLREQFDTLAKALPDFRRADLPLIASRFCSSVRANEAQFFFREKLAQLPGAESNIEQMRELILHCEALKQAQGPLKLEPLKL